MNFPLGKLTGECSRGYRGYPAKAKNIKELVGQGAGARAAWIATASARAGGRGSRRSGAFGRNCEHGKLRGKVLALALRAGSLVAPEDQSLELVLAFLTDVLKNGHKVI